MRPADIGQVKTVRTDEKKKVLCWQGIYSGSIDTVIFFKSIRQKRGGGSIGVSRRFGDILLKYETCNII